MNQQTLSPVNKFAIALPPLLLAILELFHAHGHHDAVFDTLSSQIDRWMVVHYLQLVLFPLTAWSVYSLTKFDSGWMPKISAVALGIYGIGYAAYDSIAGIGTGVLVSNSLEMASLPNSPAGIKLVFSETVQSYYHSPAVSIIARVAIAGAIVGLVLTAVQLYQRRCGLFPILMLGGACWGVTKTHAPPYGPITYGFIFAAVTATLFFSRGSRPARDD